MGKEKIAISVNSRLLKLIDSKIDGTHLRSRSQAIEFFLTKGLEKLDVDTAVILLSGTHHDIALKEIKGKTLLEHQLDMFSKYFISNIYILTQSGKLLEKLKKITLNYKININFVETDARYNGEALKTLKDKLYSDFVLMSGDTYNDFNLLNMIEKHLKGGRMGTMGLISRDKMSIYGIAVLEGDVIIDFQEKPSRPASHIVNAGIYILRPDVFKHMNDVKSLEHDLFPKLAKKRQLLGFFTMGDYAHFSEII